MADKEAIQDRLLKRNAKLAKSTEPYNSTISNIINSRFNKRNFAILAKREEERKNGQKYVGGYLQSDMDHIEKYNAEQALKPKANQKTQHYLLDEIRSIFPKREIEKHEAKELFSGYRLTLLESDDIELVAEIKTITHRSMTCMITETVQETYYAFASETDKTVVQKTRPKVTEQKHRVLLEAPQRTMARIIDTYIGRYRIPAVKESYADVWSNLI